MIIPKGTGLLVSFYVTDSPLSNTNIVELAMF